MRGVNWMQILDQHVVCTWDFGEYVNRAIVSNCSEARRIDTQTINNNNNKLDRFRSRWYFFFLVMTLSRDDAGKVQIVDSVTWKKNKRSWSVYTYENKAFFFLYNKKKTFFWDDKMKWRVIEKKPVFEIIIEKNGRKNMKGALAISCMHTHYSGTRDWIRTSVCVCVCVREREREAKTVHEYDQAMEKEGMWAHVHLVSLNTWYSIRFLIRIFVISIVLTI